MNPQTFRVGDVVEAQVSFIAAPLKDNKHKMIVVLRSIALLNATFSQVRTNIAYPHLQSLLTSMQEALKRRMCKPEPTQRATTLKRRVGYGEYYMEVEGRSEAMEVDKQVERRQRID
jgi:hypothetical protein